MSSTYDIYRQLPEDRLLWVDRVKGLEEARRLVAALQSACTEDYLVYDSTKRTIVEVFSTQLADLEQFASKGIEQSSLDSDHT